VRGGGKEGGDVRMGGAPWLLGDRRPCFYDFLNVPKNVHWPRLFGPPCICVSYNNVINFDFKLHVGNWSTALFHS